MVFKKNKNVFLFGFLTLIFFVFPFSFSGDFFVAHAGLWEALKDPLGYLLIGFQKLLGMFLNVGIWLVTIAIDADFLNKMLNGPAVETSWKAVRDICNLGFILTLLFSAFATIFQVQKYHIKNLILNIVLVALLINFSYPIVRFVADLGNVPMYYLAETLFGKTKMGSILAEESNIVCALIPHYGECTKVTGVAALQYAEGNETSELLASIVMLFILGITMFVIAILFVIRVIALCILIIFSPIGFIGLAVPPLKKYADEYWGNLVKYTIFGPVMLLMIAISTKLMHAFNESGSNMDNFGGAIAKFSVPIVILWMGINMGMKIGVAGSDITMRWGKSWGKRLSGFNIATGIYGSYSARRKKGNESGVPARLGNWLGSRQDALRSKVWLPLPGREAARRRYQQDLLGEIEKQSKENNISGKNDLELQKLADQDTALIGKNPLLRKERAAAIQELAKRGITRNSKGEAYLDTVRKDFGDLAHITQQLTENMKKLDPEAAFTQNGTLDAAGLDAYIKSSQFKLGDITGNAFTAKLMQSLMAAEVTGADLLKIRNEKNSKKIDESLTEASRTATDSTSKTHQEIQLAALMHTGEMHTGNSVTNAKFISELSKEGKMEIDVLKKMKSSFLGSTPGASTSIARNIKPNDFLKAMQEMKDRSSAKEIFDRVMSHGNAQSKQMAATDRRLEFIR